MDTNEGLASYLKFVKEKGRHPRFQRGLPEVEKQLNDWLDYRCRRIKAGKLPPEELRMLVDAGLVTSKGKIPHRTKSVQTVEPNPSYERCIEEIKRFGELHGHFRISLRQGVGRWLGTAREIYAENPADPLVQAILRDVPGLSLAPIKTGWNVPIDIEEPWPTRFSQCLNFVEKYAVLPSKDSDEPVEKSLGVWVYHTRQKLKREGYFEPAVERGLREFLLRFESHRGTHSDIKRNADLQASPRQMCW